MDSSLQKGELNPNFVFFGRKPLRILFFLNSSLTVVQNEPQALT